ncbi:MAG: GGDEF domain-containing protein [Chloroflexota bacterium]
MDKHNQFLLSLEPGQKPSISPSHQFAAFSLIILLILGGTLAWFLSIQIAEQMATTTADMIGHQVSAMIQAELSTADLREPMSGERYEAFDAFLHRNIISSQIARIKVWNKKGLVVYSDDSALIGQVFPLTEELGEVFADKDVIVQLASLNKGENLSEQGLGQLLEIYVPLTPNDSSEVLGAYEVYLYYEPIASAVRHAQIWIWAAVAVAMAALWGSLNWIFTRASRMISRQRQLAITDPLTGLPNRRYLLEQIKNERERSKRYGSTFSLIILDMDFFKKYNDAYGHPAGDEALRELANRMLKCVRTFDTIARYRGEEFAILLPETNLAYAERTANRIREEVAVLPFAYCPITVSLGVACYNGSSQNNVIAAADAALYQAKSRGRNRVCVAATNA